MQKNRNQRRCGCRWAACALVVLGATHGAEAQPFVKVVPDDAGRWDTFGRRVAVSGDTVIIGSVWDSDAGPASGSAYIFRESGGEWVQIAKLTASDAAEDDSFGMGVSISGDTAIIGAPRDDDAGENSGSAYIFREVGGVWREIGKIKPADAGSWNEFGISVTIDGGTAVVGGRYGGAEGSTYVFRECGGEWVQVGTLDAGESHADDGLSVSGDTVAVGDAWGGSPGSVHLFRSQGGLWPRLATLSAADAAAGDFFGFSVAIDGDTLLVGAHLDDDGARDSGSAYVFREIDGAWREIAKIARRDPGAYDYFGFSVALSGDLAVVGAYMDDVNHRRDRGSAYVFREIGGAWEQVARLTATDGATEDYYGVNVGVAGHSAFIGASQADGAAENSGAVYIYALQPECRADFNGDGAVDSRDIVEFLNAWSGGDVGADFDGNSTVDSRDVLAFLNAWADQC